MLEPAKYEHGGQCGPYLYLDGVLCRSYEALNAQQLLEVTEEHLNEPSGLVQ